MEMSQKIGVECIGFEQVSQDVGTGDDHALFRVVVRFHSVVIEGQKVRPTELLAQGDCTAKQCVGDVFDPTMLEVSLPTGWRQEWNAGDFRPRIAEFVERSLRAMFGTGGIPLRGIKNFVMRRNSVSGPPFRFLIRAAPLEQGW